MHLWVWHILTIFLLQTWSRAGDHSPELMMLVDVSISCYKASQPVANAFTFDYQINRFWRTSYDN